MIMIFTIMLFLIGAFGSLLLQKDDVLANIWSSFFAIAGSILGLVFAASTIVSGNDSSFIIGHFTFPLLSLSIHIDLLSAFYIFVISLIALFSSIYGFGYVKHFYKKYNIGMLGFFYNLFITGMLLVVMAANGLFFLIAWEIMSIASYFLVIYDRNHKTNIKAGFLYLVMTHIGTAFIIVAFLLMYKFTGFFDFETIKSGVNMIPLMIKNIIFILAIIGFGTKAGIIPFHIWLPAAHPAAPSHVSALMSGVMIKTGIYMMMRIFFDMFQPVPAWWGLVLLVIGSISSLLGVLFALTEHDIKKLLAYHSIENIGIILLGLGSALSFLSLNLPAFALLGLTASLFHTLNHAVFKSLLFLGAGSVINETHTRNMEEYGGLIKYMPLTALFFLIGSMAISALPPFNGFFSEWLIFQSLFQGITSLNLYMKWVFIIAAGSLAFTGGLALACFVKAFGITFLARPRTSQIMKTKESSISLLIGMVSLSILSLLFGVFSGNIVFFLEKIGKSLGVFRTIFVLMSSTSNYGLSVNKSFASISGPAFLLFFIVSVFIIIFIVRYLINKDQKEIIGNTWDCGTSLTPRMEITATGFSRSIILIFKRVLRPSIQHDIEYHDSETKYMQRSKTTILRTHDFHHLYFYLPLHRIIHLISYKVKGIQSGNTNAYILFIFIALMIALFIIL